jgi:hypothetical protein
MGAAPGDELGDHEAGFDGLAQADAVGEEEPGAAHLQGAHDGHELVGRDLQPAGLDREQGGRPEGLLQEEGLVVEAPVPEAARACGVEVRGNRGDLLEGGEEIELVAAEAPLEAAEPEALLLSGGLDVDDFTGEAAGLDLGAGEDGRHAGSAPGPRDAIAGQRCAEERFGSRTRCSCSGVGEDTRGMAASVIGTTPGGDGRREITTVGRVGARGGGAGDSRRGRCSCTLLVTASHRSRKKPPSGRDRSTLPTASSQSEQISQLGKGAFRHR